MTAEKYQRLIENSLKARNRCKKNSWGYNYWSSVMNALICDARQSNGLN
jgi:hypothetical protein|tara:strand:- start:27 stop:173 length:147 start_codon:yes stop_codon:yes gene_type:complete